MKRLLRLSAVTLGLVAAFGVAAFMAPVALAGSHTQKDCPDGVQTAYFGCVKENRDSTNLADNPIYKLLLAALKFLGVGVGIAVVGGISYGAFLIVSSNANAGQTQQGVSIIVNAFIGLLLYIFLFAIINFLVPGGLFA